MKISKRFYHHIVISIFLFILSTSRAHAQTPAISIPDKTALTNAITQQATNTGNNVNLNNNQTQKTETNVTNNNTSATNQSTTVNANTGNNTANRNISFGGNAGVIQTGNIGVVTNAQAAGNTNATAVTSPTVSPTSTTTNVTNAGDNVRASSNSATTNTTNVQNKNNTTANQSTTVNANTGNNRADRNISIGGSAGVIQTGGVGVQTNYLVAPGGNATFIGGDSRGNGPGSGASIFLTNTGNNIGATSNNSSSTSAIVANNNTSVVNQNTTVNANTGNNEASRNIAVGGDAGVIRTGAILVGTSYAVDGSQNRTAVATGSGGPSGPSDGGTFLTNSGDNVHTATNSSNDTSTSVSNLNNTFVNQTAIINANTGGNTSNRNLNLNGDAGTITTGNVGVNVSFLADFSKNTNYIYPTSYHYEYLPVQYQYITPTPQPQQQEVVQPITYINPVQDRVYYYYVYPPIRSRYASYVATAPSVNGAYTSDPSAESDPKAQLANQESPHGIMSASGLSQIMIMLISLGALAVRKVMRV